MDVVNTITALLSPFGYECSPFLIKWYNEIVNQRFQLSFEANTLAVSVISAPDMFEKAFLPFVQSSRDILAASGQDPLDECTRHCFQRIVQADLHCPGVECEVIFDFDTLPSGQPRCLVQSAGHVSGQARYYQRADVTEDEAGQIGWAKEKRIYGACAHSKYGGWFAFRGVIVLKGLQVPDLPRVPPADVLQTADERFRFLDLFNHHWQDGRFRDVPPTVIARYSQQQIDYFKTAPRERHQLLGLPAPRSKYDLSDSSSSDNDDEKEDDGSADGSAAAPRASKQGGVTAAHG
eukprot:scpid66200/ scgid6817/ Methylmalonic aciduria and homocystinuria type C protein homolog